MAKENTTKSNELDGLIDQVDALKITIESVESVQSVKSFQSVQSVQFVEPDEEEKHDTIVSQHVKKFTKANLRTLLYYSLHLKQCDIFTLLTHLGVNHYQTKEIDITAEPFTKYSEEIGKFNPDDYFVIKSNQLYLLNSSFHITMYYNGGKKLTKPVDDEKTNLEKCAELEEILDSDINIHIDQLSISQDFIIIRVKDMVAPYYGNPIKHITIGLSKMTDKKLKPVDSPSAFDINGVNEHIEIKASCGFGMMIGHIGKITK